MSAPTLRDLYAMRDFRRGEWYAVLGVLLFGFALLGGFLAIVPVLLIAMNLLSIVMIAFLADGPAGVWGPVGDYLQVGLMALGALAAVYGARALGRLAETVQAKACREFREQVRTWLADTRGIRIDADLLPVEPYRPVTVPGVQGRERREFDLEFPRLSEPLRIEVRRTPSVSYTERLYNWRHGITA